LSRSSYIQPKAVELDLSPNAISPLSASSTRPAGLVRGVFWACPWLRRGLHCRRVAGVGSSKGLRLLPSALWALAAEGTGVGSTRHVTRCGIGIRGHGEEEPFSLWFCPVRKLMLSAGLLFRLRFSWSASLVKLGFFAFLQFRQLPLQIGRCRRASSGSRIRRRMVDTVQNLGGLMRHGETGDGPIAQQSCDRC
jgi:hypothetical protein